MEIADGFQFMTKGAYHHTVATYLKQTTRKRLSLAAMETLSIIAYKQPVSKGDLERVPRGESVIIPCRNYWKKNLFLL